MKKHYARFIIVAVFIFALMGALVYQLGSLTLAQGETWTEEAEKRTTRTISVKGERGRILDRNGVVLAYSETCYNVEFLRNADNRTDYDSAVYTESLIKAIQIIEAGGGKTIDTSYIRMGEDGKPYYDWGVQSQSSIRSRYKNFCDAMGFMINDPNIGDKDQTKWDMSLWPTAEYAYNTLRKYWYIPEEMPFEDAVKIISIRQEVNLNNYRAYEPITIAYDVGLEVVSEIMIHSDELVGLSVSQSTTRVYPRGMSAAHILGYMSKSATEEMMKPVSEGGQGYASSDYVGVSGIEATMEQYLTGATEEHQGSREVEVNKNGSIIRDIASTPASNGDDVILTMDIQYQQAAEAMLEHLIAKIAETQKEKIALDEKGSYAKKTDGDTSKIKTASSGAAVVMDVHTGQIIAMASYPSFDPNWFIEGISTERYKELFNSDEAAVSLPMINKATSSRYAPGSIFKMVTGIAGIAEGKIGLTETVDDKGLYYVLDEDGNQIKSNPAKCWTDYPDKHQQQDIVKAITNSCNYYFCEVANRLGINLLDEWSGKFGLTSKTGIELTNESVGIIGGQAVLFDNTQRTDKGELNLDAQKTSLPWLVYRHICAKLKEYLTIRTMEIDDDAVKRCALKIMELQDGSLENKGSDMRRIMSEELGIPEGATIVQPWVSELMSLLSEIQWKPTLTIRSGFGQGTSLVTPVAVARYVSAIANEGTVYDVHIVDKVVSPEGDIVKQVEPSVYSEIDIDPTIWAAVKEGMRGVVSPEDGGTAADAFSADFYNKYGSYISGKTGTAQVGTNTIDIENTSWFVTYAPRENPEIAIVVCIPNGLSGKSSAPGVEELLTYYFNRQEQVAPENLTGINEMIP